MSDDGFCLAVSGPLGSRLSQRGAEVVGALDYARVQSATLAGELGRRSWVGLLSRPVS